MNIINTYLSLATNLLQRAGQDSHQKTACDQQNGRNLSQWCFLLALDHGSGLLAWYFPREQRTYNEKKEKIKLKQVFIIIIFYKISN